MYGWPYWKYYYNVLNIKYIEYIKDNIYQILYYYIHCCLECRTKNKKKTKAFE